MPILDATLTFRYATGFSVDTSFSTNDQVTGLVGPSGSGKTTLLNLIAGLLTPTFGRIQLFDRVLFDSKKGTNLPPHQRKIGYVFQDYRLFPHLSVEQNLRYGQRRSSNTQIQYAKVIEVLRLETLLSRNPLSLSGGQQQRVALGRALLVSPALLLMDEPMASVDESHQMELMAFLEDIISEFAIPTVLVSHDPKLIQTLAKSVVCVG